MAAAKKRDSSFMVKLQRQEKNVRTAPTSATDVPGAALRHVGAFARVGGVAGRSPIRGRDPVPRFRV
jgi:hypothetical protein